MSIGLKGMTWSHPRGYDPIVATSAVWKQKTGVDIAWDKRSLQDFAKLTGIDYPNRIIHPKAYTGDWDAPADEAVAEAVQGAAS